MKRGPDQPELTLYRHMDARQQEVVREAYFCGRTDGYKLGLAEGKAIGQRALRSETHGPLDEIRRAVDDMREEVRKC